MSLPLLALLALAPAADPACAPTATGAKLAGRASKYDSAMTTVGTAKVKVCYSRPLLKGRQMLGGAAAPWGTLWRTGANEPTIIHTSAPIAVAGVRLEAGSYSLYTVPRATGPWDVILNHSTTQWGIEKDYEAVKAHEIGRGKAPSVAVATPVESFTIEAAPTAIVLSWQNSKVTIPVAAAK